MINTLYNTLQCAEPCENGDSFSESAGKSIHDIFQLMEKDYKDFLDLKLDSLSTEEKETYFEVLEYEMNTNNSLKKGCFQRLPDWNADTNPGDLHSEYRNACGNCIDLVARRIFRDGQCRGKKLSPKLMKEIIKAGVWGLYGQKEYCQDTIKKFVDLVFAKIQKNRVWHQFHEQGTPQEDRKDAAVGMILFILIKFLRNLPSCLKNFSVNHCFTTPV